jgi:acyl-CoA reductase-like NAD-dependent aldehyde dehydrogenase
VIERHDPARPHQLVGRVGPSTPAHVDRVVQRSADAQRGWAATPLDDRLDALRRAADAVDALLAGRMDRDPDGLDTSVLDTAELLSRELGKVLPDCRGEIGFAAAYLRDVADRAARIVDAHDVVDDHLGRMEVRRIPYGVVAAVTPWNAPIILSMLKVGPALATGNTIVVKPSPLAPLAVTRVLHAIAGALPDGVLAVVHGDAEAGSALIGHPLVAKIAFTGGLGVGSAIARQAADRVVPTVLELGGNDAAILLEDADLDDLAIERLVQASFITTGQVCMAAKRLYVHRSRVDEVVDRYRTVADRVLVTGDPLADGTTLGPLVTAAARDRVAALVDGARAAGADVVPLGRVADPDLVAGGWYLEPTLVLGADDHAPIVADEQFGPTVPLLTFDDEDDVVARANASEVGLASSVWSTDEDRAFALARRLEAGMTFINTHNRSGMALRAPFGGVKRSGYGREYGDAGIAEYLQTHTINAPAAFRPGGAGGGAGYPT